MAGPARVALVSPGWPRERFANGIVSYLTYLRAGMRELGTRVAILSTNGGHSEQDDVIALDEEPAAEFARRFAAGLPARFRWRGLATWTAARDIAWHVNRLQRQTGLELLQLEESFGIAFHVMKAVAVPVVVRLHGPWFLNGPAAGRAGDASFWCRVRAERRAIEMATGLTAPSRDVLYQTRRHYELELEHAEVIPNPIPSVAPEERWTLQGCDRHRVLFVGRFDRHKGGDVMIEAFRHVLERFADAELTFVGPDRGLVREGRRWGIEAFLADRFPDAAARARIRWLGQQSPEALTALRRTALVTVVSSRYETFGNVATEAMAMGCPLVATQAGGLAEIVDDGKSGLLCEPDDAPGLARCIVALLRDPERAARCGEQAVAACLHTHSPSAIAARTLAYYGETLARRQRNDS